jgi:hypothetical protein
MYSVCPPSILGVTSRDCGRRGYPMIPISGFRVGILYLANDLGATESAPMLFLPLSRRTCAPHSVAQPSENIPRWGYGAYIDIDQSS